MERYWEGTGAPVVRRSSELEGKIMAEVKDDGYLASGTSASITDAPPTFSGPPSSPLTLTPLNTEICSNKDDHRSTFCLYFIYRKRNRAQS